MDRNVLEGKWKQLKGHAREEWGKLTDDDLDQVRGRDEVLVGKLQEKYGKTADEAEKAVADWFDKVDDKVNG
ncbi:MAG: CsbD family protein [Longimicrobiales bacterium]